MEHDAGNFIYSDVRNGLDKPLTMCYSKVYQDRFQRGLLISAGAEGYNEGC